MHEEGALRTNGERFGKYSRYKNDVEYHEWLKQMRLVYMPECDPEIKGARPYPKADMLTEFGPYFFTSTIAWMQALAIGFKPEAIGLWGIEGKDDWGSQRPGILHFTQVARDRGITVTVPSNCRLLDTPLHYGERENA